MLEENGNQTGESLNPAEPSSEESKTPLEKVKATQARQHAELQAARQESDNAQERGGAESEVPGMGSPSNRRKHPQRQMYGSGTNES
jgi:hypothetical protein